ncbi:cytochrome P450 [Lentzea flava]|uniref:Cytochrome P450 BJ-3 n=1 Tax=Lentzea flava TaxID=103732 RepID=A0ABQ2VEY6_9PSEU|nr:cytochrome P450 [Lentzea flava]MCP2205046.1 Cytochrome P450 [Lentzea flava]GGU82947.1 cytochrome P450 BJ-3 [Lentzea flava]
MTAQPSTTQLDAMARLQEPDNREDPYPFLAWLREHDPVHRTPRGTYILSRHADVARVLRESGDVFLSPDRTKLTTQFPEALQHRSMAVFASSIAVSNPPAHTRLRKVVSREFTARRVAELRPRITALCERLIEEITEPLLDGEEVDLQQRFAEPLSVGTLSALLGVPTEDQVWLASLVEGVLSAFPGAPIEVIARADQLTADMEAYLVALIERRRKVPEDDLITALSAPDGGLAEDELVPMLWALWCAGFKTSSAGVSNGVLAMLEYPEQLDWVERDASAFSNEVLRHNPPTILTPFVRIAVRDVEFDGGTVVEGSDVRLMIGAANRDPEVFADPERFAPSRDTKASLAFGGGIHFCAGAGLARVEIETALPRLRARLPLLTRCSEPTWSPAVFHHMPRTLPVVHGSRG